MTTVEPVPVTYDQLGTIDPAAYERLCTLVVLHRLRDRLLNYGWVQGELWPDQDVAYRDTAEGPTCLVGGLVVALGRTDLAEGKELDEVIAHHPAAVALDETISTYPDAGKPEASSINILLGCGTAEQWAELNPGDRVAVWNDEKGRTVAQVVALIDETIDRLETT